MFKDLLGQKRTLVHDAIDEVVTMLEPRTAPLRSAKKT